MVTTEEIERRVEQADAARSAKRSATAQRVGELAARHGEIAEQLGEIERELGDVLVESSDVIEIGELATFTDVPAADLTRWLERRKTQRTKRKKKPAAPRVSENENASTSRDVPLTRDGAATTLAGVT